VGTPLATAFVRIRPDTIGFRSETEKKVTGDLGKVGAAGGTALGKSLIDALNKVMTAAGVKVGQSVADEFAKGFNERVKDKTGNAPVGPSKPRTRKQGEESAGSYADGFKRQLEQAARSLPPLTVGVAKTAAEQAIRDVQARLQELSGKTIGVDVDAAAAITQVRSLENQLRLLAATSPDVQVQADTAEALVKLGKLTAEADKLDGRHVEVDVDVDTDKASSAVSRLASNLTAGLAKAFSGVNSSASAFFQALSEGGVRAGAQVAASLAGAAASTAAMTASTGGLNLVLGAAATALLVAGAATAGLATGFVALAPIVSTVGGLLGAIPGLLFGTIAAAGALKLGLGGVGGALSAMVAAQDDATKSSGSFAGAQNAIANASDQVKSALASQANTRATVTEAARRAAQQILDAERTVGQARKEAGRQAQEAQQRVAEAAGRVRDAQRTLTDAEQAALDVRKELTRAQTEARQNLEDLASQVKGNALDQRQAALDVKDARKALDKVLADKKATQEQREQAQLTYDRQVQQLTDLQVRGKRLAAEQTDANKKGVAGSEQVVAVRKRIADADKGVADARRGVADAQAQVRKAEQAAEQARVAGQERVATAERALADARRAQSAQQRQGAFQLAQASQSVVSAQRALAQASTQAGTAGGSALQNLNRQMSELSPNAQTLVKTLFGLKAPFDGLRKFVSDRLLDGVAGQVRDLAGKWLPPLREILGKLADRFNGIGDGLFKAFGRTDFIENVKTAVGGFDTMLGRIGDSIPGVIDAFGRIGAASTPVLESLGELIGKIFDKFSAWIKSADETGKLDTFMEQAAATLDQIFTIGGLVFDIFGKIVQILFPQSKETSDGFLGGVERFLRRILDWLSDPKNQQAIRDWINDVKDFVGRVGTEFMPKIDEWLSKIDGWVDRVGGWVNTVERWGTILSIFLTPAVPRITANWNEIRDKAFEPMRRFTTEIIPQAFGLMRLGIVARFNEATTRAQAIWALLKNTVFTPMSNVVTQTIPSAFAAARDRVAARFGEMRDRISGVWAGINASVFAPLRNAITRDVPNAFKTGVDAVKTQWSKLTNVAKEPVRFVVSTVLNGGLIAGYNKIASVFGVGKVDPIALPKGFARGGVLPGYTPGRDVHRFASATGGVLDLSGGEAVMRPEWTKAVGAGQVDAMNAAARSGGVAGVRRAMGYAKGGIVGRGGVGDGLGDLWTRVREKAGDIIDGARAVTGAAADPGGTVRSLVDRLIGLIPGQNLPWGKLVTSMPKKLVDAAVSKLGNLGAAPAKGGAFGGSLGGGPGNSASPFGGSAGMMRALRGMFPGLRLISGFRPGATIRNTGRPSLHGSDRAVDVPPLREVAQFINQRFRNVTRELITPFQEFNLLRGKPHTYTGAVWRQHNFAGGNAHVHWGAKGGGIVPGMPRLKVFDNGGPWQPGTLGINTSGRTEYVDSNRSGMGMADVAARLDTVIHLLAGLGVDIAEAQRVGARRTSRAARAGGYR
jgi:hypothetical protein